MKVLITAGPTYEPIDPVRYIGNRSSGKMGIQIANQFVDLYAADVVLVLGPSSLGHTIDKKVTVINVETAEQMYNACLKHTDANVIICSAAVADYKVSNYSDEKIKKSGNITLELEKNVDILYELGKIKKENQYLVGFALETQNLIEYAKAKVVKKNLDLIVANYSNAMNSNKSAITLINKDFEIKEYPEQEKLVNAFVIAKHIKKNI